MTTKKSTTPASNATEALTLSHLEQVQAKFIKEVQEKGLVHVLEWSGSWYDRAANAELEDAIELALPKEFRDHAEALELIALDRLLPEAGSVNNFSTSAGHNLMSMARVAAAARALNQSHRSSPATSTGRRARWDAVRADRDKVMAAFADGTPSATC